MRQTGFPKAPFRDTSPQEGTRAGVEPGEIPEIRGFPPRAPGKNAVAGVLARSIFPGFGAIPHGMRAMAVKPSATVRWS